MIEYWKHLVALATAIGVLGGAATVLKDYRWVTPKELYTVASELEDKLGEEKARKVVKEAEDDERYWDQKVKSGMWHEPADDTISKRFWLEEQKRALINRLYYEQRVRDLKR